MSMPPAPSSLRRSGGAGRLGRPRPRPNIQLDVPVIVPRTPTLDSVAVAANNAAHPAGAVSNNEISVDDAFNKCYARNAESLLSLPTGELVSPPVAAVGDLRQEDVQSVRKLGEGASGTVMLCRHVPSGTIMAKKSVPADPNPTVQRQIIRELRALRRCHSPYIVSFYGAYIEDDDIAICMEYCEGGSLDAIYKRIKTLDARIGEGVLGKVAEAVLNGLVYLHQLEIIHRDVKPSNILINGLGQIKLCDFGVSGELVDSVARTFLGTSYYMAPERIQGGGKGYKVSSDVWSLGLTIMEVAEGRFPFPPQGHRPLAMFELLDYVVTMPVPELGDDWSDELRDFVRCCLRKDPNHRPTPKQMLTHQFVVQSIQQEVDLKTWINEVWA